MASTYINSLNAKKKKALNILKSSSNTSKIGNQVSNYKKRLSNVGEEADDRNFLEKALNLPENQNMLFDIAEILGRPQKAIFGAVDAIQNKEDIGEAALEGLKGNKTTQFKDILTNAGMSDREGKLDLVDILGGVGDVFLDPTNIAFGVGAASKVAKGAKGAKALISGADVISDAGKVLGKLDDASRVVNETGKVVGILDKATGFVNPLKKDLTQRAFEAVGKYVAKPVAKAADFGVSKALQGLDAMNGIKYANSGANLAQDLGKTLPEGIKEGTNVKGALELYKEAKTGIKNSFDFAKSVPKEIWNRRKISEGAIRKAQAESASIGKGVKEAINNYAVAKNIDPKMLDEQIALLTEDNLDKNIGIKKIISYFDNKVEDKVIRVIDEDKEALTKMLDELGDAVNYKLLKNGDIKITKIDKKKLKSNPELMKKAEGLSFTRRLDYSPEQLKLIEEARNNPELMKLYSEKIEPSYRQISEIWKRNTGIDYSPITNREGYLHRVANRDALGVSDVNKYYKGAKPNTLKTSAMRKYENQAVTNVRKAELPKETIENINKKIEKKTMELSDNKSRILNDRKIKLHDSINAAKEKAATRIEKIDSQSAKVLRDTATKESQKISILNELNRKNLKEYSKIATPEQLGSLMRYGTDSDNYSKQLDSILKELDNPNISNNRMKQLVSKLDATDKKLLEAENKTYEVLSALDDLKTKNGFKSVKRTVTAFEESNYLTSRIAKNTNKLGELNKSRELISSSVDDVVSSKLEQINYLDSQIKNIDPKNDAVILNQIDRMKKDIEFLQNKDSQKLFNISYTESLFDFIDNYATRNANGMLLMNDVLFDTAMSDTNLIRVARAGEKAPVGYKIMKSEKIIEEMENWDDLFKTESVKSFIENFKGSDIMVDKRIANMIEPTLNPTTSNTILNTMDKINNTFKKFKTLSPGFQMRNLSGGWVNMTLAGIPQEVAMPFSKMQRKSLRILSNAQDLVDKSARGLLSKGEIEDYKLLSQMMGAGFFNSTDKLYDMEEVLNTASKNVVGKTINKVTKFNNNMNQYTDNMFKMTLLDYFNKNPKALAESGFNNPVEAVKGILFSPNASDLSPFERNTMKRIVPFYTFTKQNLMFQFKNSIKNPKKYKQLIKASNIVWDGVYDDDQEYAKWEKEGFLLPLPFQDEKGNNIVLKMNLPLSDLGEYMSNPLGRTVSAVSPMIKAPFEMVTGKDTFTGAELDKTNLVDLFGKYSGLDLFTSQPEKIKKLASGEQTDMQNLATMFPSMALYNDREKAKTNNEYQELEKYQQKVSDLKKQGVEVPTITEINKNNSALARAKIIMKNLKKYRQNKNY